jgi:tetratricopeptide (TPR) repeat protein
MRKANRRIELDMDELYEEGRQLIDEGMFFEAANTLAAARLIDPFDTDLMVLLGMCHIECSQITEGVKLVYAANQIQPNEPNIEYNLAYGLMCMGRAEDALVYIQKCLEHNPEKEAIVMANKLIKAAEEIKASSPGKPDIPLKEEFLCHDKFRRAQNYLFEEKYAKAMRLYNEILLVKPGFRGAITNIGLCHLNMGNYNEAIACFEKDLKQDPHDPLCLVNLAKTYHMMGNLAKSGEYTEELVQSVSDPSVRDLIRVITFLTDMGRLKETKALINKFHREDSIQLRFLEGVVHAKEHEYDKAAKIFLSLSERSTIAKEYYGKTSLIKSGKIKDYDFKPALIESSPLEYI